MDCELRPWRTEYAEDLAVLLNNKNISDNLRDGLPYPYTANDARDFIKAMLDSDKNNTFAFSVFKNNELVGSIGIFRQNNIHSRTAELGYYIGEKFWNKGIATEAVSKACRFVFGNSDIIRILLSRFQGIKRLAAYLKKQVLFAKGY